MQDITCSFFWVACNVSMFILDATWTIEGHVDHLPFFHVNNTENNFFVTLSKLTEMITKNEKDEVLILTIEKLTYNVNIPYERIVPNVLGIDKVTKTSGEFKFPLKVRLFINPIYTLGL